MRIMKIALDLDGTLADIVGLWLEEYNIKNNIKLRYEHITKWDFWINLGYTPTRFFKELSECWKRWYKVKPIENNISLAVDNLRRFGKIDIVTARDKESSKYAKEWLKYHNIKHDNFILVEKGTDKAYLDYDIFIDDSPINAQTIASLNKLTLLYDQPWNKGISNNKNIIRIKSLFDALELIPKVIT